MKISGFKTNLFKLYNIIFLFLFALIVRLAYILLIYNPNISKSFSDDFAYMQMVQNILDQGYYLSNLELLGSYASVVGPGIGWVLLPVVAIFGANWLAIFIYVAIGSALISVLVFKIAEMLYNKRTAFFAALWSVFFVSFIKYTISAGKDIWMTLFFLLTIYLIIKLDKKNKTNLWLRILTAFVFTLLFHTDERFLFVSPILFLFMFIQRIKPFQLNLKKSLLFTLFVLLFTLPWTLRNYKVYNRIILVSVRTAPFTDNLFGYEPKEYFPSNENRWFISKTKVDSIQKGLIAENKLLNNFSNQQVEAIKKGITPKEFTYAQTVWSCFINFWEPIDFRYSYYQDGYRFDGKWSLKHNVSVGLSYGIVLFFSVFGIYFLFNSNKRINTLIILLVLTYFFVHLFFIPFTKYRYRLPIEPIIIIYGCYGLYFFYNRFLNFVNNRKN